MVVNEIHGNVLMCMLSVMYNTHTSRIIYRYYLLHESEWNMARYFKSRRPYFHEPQASDNIA